jgi:hypothetical protein
MTLGPRRPDANIAVFPKYGLGVFTADQWDGARLIDEKIETRSGGGAEHRGDWEEEGAEL